MRVVQVSDIHLSPTHGFFVANWRKTASWINALAPDLVVVTGDLCINGPEDNDEIAFARTEVGRLSGRWRALPGNHDVGDEPPGQVAEQLIDPSRLARWRRWFQDDWWLEDDGAWRLIGLNAQLFGSGLADETRQADWLDAMLSTPDPRDVAIFLHKPLFIVDVEDRASSSCMTPQPRRQLIDLFARSKVRLVASGHLHCYRHARLDALDLVWAPASSFLLKGAVDKEHGDEVERGRPDHSLGVIVHDFTATGWSHRVVQPDGLTSHRAADMKQGRYRYFRDMPPCPPEAA
jgi:3',5'-cyclic AMP phosphodiesterase CpdA